MRGTSTIIICDYLEQRDVVRLHPKEKYENNTRTIIRNIFCAKGGFLLSNKRYKQKMGGIKTSTSSFKTTPYGTKAANTKPPDSFVCSAFES